MTRVLALLALGLLAGCSDSREVTAVETESPAVIADASVGAASARSGIAALKRAWDQAWVNKDASAFADQYVLNSELVSPLGAILSGREAIRAQHAFLFAGPFAGSTSTTEIRRTVYLAGDARMVDLDVTLTGYVALPPGLHETAPGEVRTRVKWIVVLRQDSWKILAQQITAVAPTP
jgi:uncharacterized protein (TIGR02246 family)